MAAVGSGFCPVLISGLKGTGRAKVWLEDDRGMAVKFLPVSKFVAQRLPGQPVAPDTWGQGEGLIREFIPAPCYELKVIVENAAPGDNFTVNASTTRGQQLASTTFVGPEWTSTAWPPDSYNVTLSTTGHEVEPLDPGPADLYDACTLHFRKGPPNPSAPAIPPPAPLPPSMTIRAPSGASLRILSVSRPEEIVERTGEFAEPFAPGHYRVEMLDRRGAPVAYHEVVMEADRPQVIDLRGFVQSPLRYALLARLPRGVSAADFSETLSGPTPDQGLDLWLATIGAARILQRAHDDFSRLYPLPLASFFDVPAHGAPVYVLAGFDEPPERVMVTLDGATQKMDTHPELPGLFELSTPWAIAGSHLVTLEVDGLAPLTLATASVAGRVTLVTFSRHAGEAIRMRQLILPVPHLIETYWRDSPFDTVRRSVEVQRQFEGGRELSALLGEDELIDLLYFKWTEAVMCLLGAYELARRGHAERLREAAYNLQQKFPELPDSHVIARLAGLQAALPALAPLVLDGFLGLEERLPSPPGTELDHRGPWTLWRGAGQSLSPSGN